jgi:succinate dehydrogenase/fumarate reductase flavoprotein subunit
MARNGSPSRGIPDFDETFDVIVIGFGFAGAFSAIHAADAGRRVLLAEKQAVPGGISICSYGSMRCARSADDAFAYLKATNAGRTPQDVLRALADGMTGIEQEIRKLAEVNGAKVGTRDNGGITHSRATTRSTIPISSRCRDSTTPRRFTRISAAAVPAMAGA